LPTSFRRQKHNPGETSVANVYIEARPKGHTEGDRIDHYVVEDHADHVLATFPTQREAIEWAKREGHAPLVARVRHLNDKKSPITGGRREAKRAIGVGPPPCLPAM
jgi:hypothetical protein